MSNQSFKLYHKLTENSVIRDNGSGIGDHPTHTTINVVYSKGRGYYAHIQNVTRIHPASGLVSESCMVDMSGENSVYFLRTPRFNAKTLAKIREKFTPDFVDKICEVWNKDGMSAAKPLIQPLFIV